MMVYPSVREKAAVEKDQSQVWTAVRGEAKGAVGSSETVTVESAVAPVITREALSSAIASAGTQDYGKIYKSSPIGASVETVAAEISRRFSEVQTRPGAREGL